MARIRVGVVILLPEPFATEVNGLRRALGDPMLDRVAPHLTLVPPVNVRLDRLDEALDVLRAAAGATRPFVLEIGPASTFWPDTPVVKLSVDGAGRAELDALRERVFVGPLARPLTWPFVPHVTLADGADPAAIPFLVAAVGWTGSFPVTVVHLLQEGADRRWTVVHDVALARPAVVGRGGIEVELATSDAPGPQVTLALGLPAPFTVTARRQGVVVGAASGTTSGSTGHLHHLVVATADRGLGVGSRLLEAVTSLAASRGCEALDAHVGDGLGDRFLRRHGWRAEHGQILTKPL